MFFFAIFTKKTANLIKKIYFLNLHNAYNLLTGDNLVSMLLKPSYTTQESEKVRIVNQS